MMERLRLALGELRATLTQRKMFVVHMDDLLTVLRDLRKAGFTIRRGHDATGKKGIFFEVYSNEHTAIHALVIADIHRTGERGQCIAFDEPKPDLKLKFDDALFKFEPVSRHSFYGRIPTVNPRIIPR